MNLAEALNSALPELPVNKARIKRLPRMDPKLIGRLQTEEGKPVVVANMRGTTYLYRFSPEQWELIQMFDGERSYAEVAQLFTKQTGAEISEKDAQEFADALDDGEFWYRTPQERNIALMQKLSEQRHQHVQKKSKVGDVSRIHVSHWDPDEYFNKITGPLSFVYSGWFTFLTVCLFTFMVYIFIDRWSEIGRDTLLYYDFGEKNFNDLVEFWILFFVMAFFHESSHGLTCKHYGGQVHQMGFHLIWLTPAFYVDVTEAWVYANRLQRLVTIIAGIWVEMIFCGLGTVVWWGTAPGTFAHELAYKVMLITGVAVVLVNMNPLIKLDGYYFFSELLCIVDIKEKSTAFVTGWIKKNIFHLAVEVEHVPLRRRFLYVPYCILSGIYSYGLLFIVVKFLYHVFLHYSPEWAFIPAALVGYKIYKSRIHTFGRFMKTIYIDKKELLRAWVTPQRIGIASAVLLLLVIIPWRHVNIQGRFILEPAKRATVRAMVPGSVAEILVKEGQGVKAGQLLGRLTNLSIESEAEKVMADYRLAQARAVNAQLRYAGFGSADAERQQLQQRAQLMNDKVTALILRSPIDGIVVTPRPGNKVSAYVKEGDEVITVSDTSSLQARVYVPEFDMGELKTETGEASAEMHLDGMFTSRNARVTSLAPVSSELEAGLAHVQNYSGLAAPRYFAATLSVQNTNDELREGMTGSAKIDVGRRSLAYSGWLLLRDFTRRKLW